MSDDGRITKVIVYSFIISWIVKFFWFAVIGISIGCVLFAIRHFIRGYNYLDPNSKWGGK